MFTRIFALSLAVLLALSVLACGETDTGGGQTPVGGAQPSSDVTTVPVETDYLPDKDYGGADFTLLIRKEFASEFDLAEMTGDVVDDAVYKRNAAVGERYGVKLVFKQSAGSWSARSEFMGETRSCVLSGTDNYQLIVGAGNYMASLVLEGLFLDLNTIEYVRGDKPWWSQGFIENFTLDDRLYLISGDAALSILDNAGVFFFNKQLLKSYNIEDPYALVRSGRWTFDKMTELSAAVGGDADKGEDTVYGYVTVQNMIRALVTSLDLPYTTKDASGNIVISFMNDKTVKAVDMMNKTINEMPTSLIYTSSEDTLQKEVTMSKMFADGRILFLSQTLSCVGRLRDMQADYGILPFPKYDEAQDGYFTRVIENVTVFAVPSSVSDAERSGIILEALCRESADTVVPAYYDVALQSKFTRDEDSGEMLDLIHDGSMFAFGYLDANTDLQALTHTVDNEIMNKNGTFVSSYETNIGKYQTALAKVLEEYRGLAK